MTYQYHCDTCNQDFEINCPVEQRNNQTCPSCGTLLRRLLSRVYIRIPRSFRQSPSNEEFFTPIWQPIRYGVSKKELLKQYDESIKAWLSPTKQKSNGETDSGEGEHFAHNQ